MIARRGERVRLHPRRESARLRPSLCSLTVAALILVLGAPSAIADGGAPTDPEIARAIARGVDFLKSSQVAVGAWNEPFQAQHRLGVTALAGLWRLENGGYRCEA